MKVDLSEKSHKYCLLCGKENPFSLGLEFYMDEKGLVSSSFCGNKKFQGYEGILHGGVISALLDSTMTNCLALNGIEAVTGELKVRYLESIPYNACLDIRAWITGSKSRLYFLKSEIKYNNKLMARAEALFMKR